MDDLTVAPETVFSEERTLKCVPIRLGLLCLFTRGTDSRTRTRNKNENSWRLSRMSRRKFIFN